MYELIHQVWPYITALVTLMLMLGTAGHAILHKEDTRAAVGWVGVIWLAPLIGSILYVLLGINRISRRAAILRGADPPFYTSQSSNFACSRQDLLDALPPGKDHVAAIQSLVGRLTSRPLVHGNRFTPLENGDAAYPEMLAAIKGAKESISLTTFILDNDAMGRRFGEALWRAMQRGVEVRVLIDAIGARYSFPSSVRFLRRWGIPVAVFMPSFVPIWTPFMNLRSHKKILVVDGRLGFTGGMNIRNNNMLAQNPPHPVKDLHFRVEGPVVSELQEVFVEDWTYTTGEKLEGPPWFPDLDSKGMALARGITDGPDEDIDKLPLTLMGALSTAEESVRIVTPYFLPDHALINTINVTAMRGVSVDIVLPEKNNIRMVQWACNPHLELILGSGVRVWFTPPPFDHTKLMIVDNTWTLLGSANWDPRSLRLNFEFNVECYDAELAHTLNQHINDKLCHARQVTKEELANRLLASKLRDGVARLFTPYL